MRIDWIWAAGSSSGTSDNFKIAIVGALGLVLAAAIPAWLSSREKVRERQTSREPDYRTMMSDAIRQRDAVQRKLDDNRLEFADYKRAAEEEKDRLERIIWKLGHDPTTGRPTRRQHGNQTDT